MLRPALLTAGAVLVTALSAAAAPSPGAPVPQGGSFDPPVAQDINPAPGIVEVNLAAAPTTWQFTPGVDTTVWAYNNSVPGPTIIANLGDTIIVHFTNNLPVATTIHWHGMAVPADMDGSHVAQLHVQPGETFDYQFDALESGFFWYHPHVSTADQVERGLHGGVIIKDPAIEQALAAAVPPATGPIEEHVVVFDDVLLDGSNQIVPAFSFTDPLQNAMYHINGREGNILLVNGRAASGVNLSVPNGVVQRWRIVNTSNSSFCRLDFNDATTGLGRNVWRIGVDGSYLEQPLEIPAVTNTAPGGSASTALLTEMDQGVLLMPGQRMDVMFTPIGTPGQTFTVQQTDWARGRVTATYAGPRIVVNPDPMDGSYPNQTFLALTVTGPDPGTGEYTPPAQLTTYPALPGPSTGDLPVSFSHGNPNPQGNVRMFAQTGLPASQVTSFDAHDVFVGDVKEWVVTNRSPSDHPFHSHGFSFELLEFKFEDDLEPLNPLKNFTWLPPRRTIRDTVRVPPRLGMRGFSRCIARLRAHFDDTGREGRIVAHGTLPTRDKSGKLFSGGWLFHCHVLEHSAAGMLSFFELRDPADPFHYLGFSTGGLNGKPSLTGRGIPAAGQRVDLDVVDALPFAPGIMVLSVNVMRLSRLGVIVVPGPDLIAVPAWTDAAGEVTVTIPSWPAVAAGVALYWQAGFADPGAPEQLAMTNALRFTTQ